MMLEGVPAAGNANCGKPFSEFENPMNWEDVRFFLAVARTGSLSEAASQLEVSPSTMARRIARLEADLQRTLFVRRHDGYRLTQLGSALLGNAERVEAQVHTLRRTLDPATDKPKGTVRVATPELLAHEIIMPALPSFRAAHPAISLEFVADVRPVSLSKRSADVVVRVVRPNDGDYKIRRIGKVSAALFASPAYLGQRGHPTKPQDLAKHDLIGWDHELKFLVMAKWLSELAGAHQCWLTTNSMTSQYLACRAGLGLAVLPSLVGRNAGLTRVLPKVPALELDLWLLVSLEVGEVEAVKRVADFLRGVFADPALAQTP